MLNIYTPFPRYEQAIFIGDKACEYLSALNIHAYAIIGGEVPSMEILHPYEKSLECIACAMRHKPKILFSAIEKISAKYVLLENNHRNEYNPSDMLEKLVERGIKIKILDVCGSVPKVLERAAQMFQAQAHAKRIIDDYKTRFSLVRAMQPHIRKNQKILILLSIRQPITLESYLFVATDSSDISKTLETNFFTCNVVRSDKNKETLQGLIPITELNDLLLSNPDAIALCGDGLSLSKALEKACRSNPEFKLLKAIHHGRVWPLPYYCDALAWREPLILQLWGQALREKDD